MDTRTSERVQRDFRSFTSILASAVLEWLLMFLLFVDALFSYLVTKFAQFCELQTPCLLCSRLDHILGSEKADFYRELICRSHKLEISSLVYCHVHEKLSDAHGMCESCFSSCATYKRSDYGAFRSMGKVDPYIEYCVDDNYDIHLKSSTNTDVNCLQKEFDGDGQLKDPLLKVTTLDSSSKKHCSCCGEPLSTVSAQRLLRAKSIEGETTELDVPLSGLTGHVSLHCRDGLKNRREKKLTWSTTMPALGNQGFDPLSHIGYTELKITSDSESEVPISDDDNGIVLTLQSDDLKEIVTKCAEQEKDNVSINILPKVISSDSDIGKPIHQVPVSEHSPSVPVRKFDTGKSDDDSSFSSPVIIGHGLDELNCNQDEARVSLPVISELISLDEPPAPDNIKEALVEVTENLDAVGIGEAASASNAEKSEVLEQENGLICTDSSEKMNQSENDHGPSMLGAMDLNDAYKLAIGTKESQPSCTFTEPLSWKDSSSIREDMKLLLSQISSVRGFELSWNDPSPRVHVHGDDSKMFDASSVIGLQIPPKRLSMERNESGTESLDGSLVSEIEGETLVDRLKRQFELDRKAMSALYKELEEERNASAISANQAMAMINRLQEEKAAMQMEALQYQRMMEEQAEYDQEALQTANDLLADKEKEIQDLEEEFEAYRRRYPDELNLERISSSDLRDGESVNCHENSIDHMASKTAILKDSLLDFEDEKVYISNCLKKLENKLQLFSSNGVHVDTSEHDSNGDSLLDNRCADGMLHGFSEEQDHTSFVDNVGGNGGPSRIESLGESDVEELHSMATNENDIVALRKQVSHLSQRLKTLEADRNFLEHTIKSLRNGNEGLEFIREIALHLRELRSIGIERREQDVA